MNALDVPCLDCGATFDQPCWDLRYSYRVPRTNGRFHWTRIDLARILRTPSTNQTRTNP